MRAYAGIGSRRLDAAQLEVCREVGRRAGKAGWRLMTGAAVGADQAFAEGAIEVGGLLTLCLPWSTYEQAWVRWAVARGKALVRVLQPSDAEAWASVALHPAAARLSRGARALHARNHLIVSGCLWVAAYPVADSAGRLGGTGQGMLLAERLGIPVLDLRTVR